MQAQPCAAGIARAFIQVVQTQARQTGQVAEVVGSPGVAGQVGKRRIGRAQGIVTQRVAGQCLGALLAAALRKKAAQQATTFFGQYPALHLGLVVDLGMPKQVEHRACRPGLGFHRAIHHPRQPRVQHGATAHGAGLQRDVQAAAVQPVVAQALGCRTQGDDLGMGRGVMVLHRGIAASGDDLTVLDHDGAHRHLARAGCGLRLGQGQSHPVRVVGHFHYYIFNSSQGIKYVRLEAIWLIFFRLQAWGVPVASGLPPAA